MRAEQTDRARQVTEATLTARVAREFGDAVVVFAGSGRPVPPTARLALFVAEGDPSVVKFGRWARAARLPAAAILLDGERALVGPLSTPGLPGCADCARQRRVAAAAASRGTITPRVSHTETPYSRPLPGLAAAIKSAQDPDETQVVRDDDPDRTTAVPPTLLDDPDRTTAVPPKLIDDVERTGSQGSVAGVLDLPDPQLDKIIELLKDGAKELVDHVAEIVDGEVLWHRVIPLPDCDVCGGADGLGTVSLPTGDDPAVLLESLAGWVDPLTGVIPWIALKQPLGTGPDLPFVATAAPPHRLDADGVPRALPIGWGKGATRCAAIVSAVGEAIERYAPSLPDGGRIVWARPADLDGDVLDPRDFPLYEPETYRRPGFEFAAFDRRVDHPWVRGTWLGTDRSVWVPAVFTYLSMTLLREHLISQGTSNGLAAGTDAESATTRAVLELVERDAMMAAWLTGAKGRYVDLDETLDVDLRAIVDALQAQGPGVEVYLLPTSMYGVTAVALSLGDGRRWPGVTLGLGADRSPRNAIRAALLELAQTAPHLAALLRDRAHPVPQHPQDVRAMLDHAAYFFPKARVDAFDRLRCGGTSRLRDLVEPVPETSVADLAGVLGAASVRVAIVDVTSADVAMGPFRVVRAVSPDLQPISYGHGNDRAPVPRLRDKLLPPHRRQVHPIW
ncbi:YcaO-like family protein [Actinokineospora sp. HUAS TT18]|uniref:YcaO-like family protein n=1 Tax=Actinokineospora sp. HUAS TT18 TaxID=3447451 RepID=UPI003F527510